MKHTPTTRTGLTQYDRLPPEEAIRRAWAVPGSNPAHHRRMQEQVRAQMPLLARALDRLTTQR